MLQNWEEKSRDFVQNFMEMFRNPGDSVVSVILFDKLFCTDNPDRTLSLFYGNQKLFLFKQKPVSRNQVL